MSLPVPILHPWAAWGFETPLPSSRHNRFQIQKHWDCRQSKRTTQSRVACVHHEEG